MKISIFDAALGIAIERDMNEEELAQWELDKAERIAREEAEEQARLEAETKAALKVAALAKLGLTEEEINAFLA